jgi:putative transposase
MRRLKVCGSDAIYHCMTRTVNGEFLFEDRDKEVLRRMIRQVADFSGVEILTYCIMSNHFHVLVRVPYESTVSDRELMRRYRVLYPNPTKYQEASARLLESRLQAGGEIAAESRRKLLVRMADVSEFMKTLKQRFSVWYNRSHRRYGTLWAERFKSVLVEGGGNPLQTMAAYIDLNPVRAGLAADPKDYRFCGYAEAVAGGIDAGAGLLHVWASHGIREVELALRSHRLLIFGKYGSVGGLSEAEHRRVVKILNAEDGHLAKAVVLRCRVRYFTDGVIFGSSEFVHSLARTWQRDHQRKHPVTVNALRGSDWGDLAVIHGLRRSVFS